jgi:hypothetical protein
MSTAAGPCRAFEDIAKCLHDAGPLLEEVRKDDGRQFAQMIAEDVLSALVSHYPDLDVDVIRQGPVWGRKALAEQEVQSAVEFIAAHFDPYAGVKFPGEPESIDVGEDEDMKTGGNGGDDGRSGGAGGSGDAGGNS